MSTIDRISPDELGAWDAFVARHPLGLVYHLSSWQRALETAFGHIRGRLLVLKDDASQIQAGLPVYNVRSWLLKNRTVSVPFADICDPLVSTKEEFGLLWQAIEDTARQHKSKKVKIRIRRANTDCLPALLRAGAKYKHHYPGSAPTRANPSSETVPGSLYAAARLLRYTPAAVQKSFGDFCYRHLG